jgi:hypothetical protein
MSHTPGPWTAKIYKQVIEIIGPKGEVIVRWPGFDGSSVSGRKNKANARLIAAAPDLLKACIAAQNALRSYQYGNSSPDLAKEVADFASAVITKAAGGA